MKGIYAVIGILFFSISTLSSQTRYLDSSFDVDKQQNIKYGIGPISPTQSTDLECDFYLPLNDSKTDRAVIIIAHAGSFQPDYGSKEEPYIEDFSNAMAARGFVVMAINYRIGWQIASSKETNSRNALPAVWRAIQDYKTAVRFLRKTVAEDGNPYGIDPNMIIGGGFGAGGYLPVNAMLLDDPSEVMLPELRQRNILTGQRTNTPYIDTTQFDLGGIYDTKGGHPGYSYRLSMILNFSGAIPTPEAFDLGQPFPPCVSTHSDEDEATPYGFGTVRALSLINVIDVYGSFEIHNELENRGLNQFWKDENRDGYPQANIAHDGKGPFNMYQRGLYTFLGKTYMWSNDNDPYTNSNYATQYRTEMDTVVTFSAFRIEKWISNYLGIENNVIDAEVMRLSPNPSNGNVTFMNRSSGVKASKLEIFDLNGKLVTSKRLATDFVPLDLTELANGTYTTVVTHDGGQVTDKLVIQK